MLGGTAYYAPGITAHADEEGNVRTTGIFDAELPPASRAAAKAGAREEDPRLDRQLPVVHRGVVGAGHPRRRT